MRTLEAGGQKELADNLRSTHLQGVPGKSTRALTEPQRQMFTDKATLDDKVKDVMNYAQQHVGSVNPQVIKVAAQKAHELTKFYNASTDNLGMTAGRLNWLDAQVKKNPTSIIQYVLGNQQVLGEIRNSNAHQRDIQAQKLGFPVNPGPPGTSSDQRSQQTIERVDPKTGKTIIYDANTKQPLRWK
jgi:hypothetical protein